MFNADQVIDTIQNGKKQFVNTFVVDAKFKEELVKLIDAQTNFAKGSVKSSFDIAQAFVKKASDAVYKKAV